MKETDYADLLYGMFLGETWDVNDYSRYLRVPGGWIYEDWGDDGVDPIAVFIPYSNEFQELAKRDV